MSAKIILSVTKGAQQGKQYSFDERDSCLIGRHDECGIQLPNDEAHKTVSRYHALLDINPPMARIRDFGSLNGTFVNGQKIGQRDKGTSAAEGAQQNFPEHDLNNGDEIRVGDSAWRVKIVADKPQPAQPQRAQPPAQPVAVAAPTPRAATPAQREVSELIKQILEEAQREPQALKGGQGSVRDYKIVRELGKGGMGAVYLARHRKTGQTVALKVMLPRVAVEPHARELFLREVENTRVLRHPNLVQLLDYSTSGQEFFFTLEFCDGGSVSDYMEDRNRVFSPAEALDITLQVLDGLEFAHTVPFTIPLPDGSTRAVRGLVHRDLSPQNVLLDKTSGRLVAKVSDFGLGKAFDTAGLSGQTMTGDAAGKPVFMPRQQVVNFKFSKPEVDVWAAAASLYWMLTAEVPRDFPDGADPWRVVLQTDAVPLRKRWPQAPSALGNVIDLALRDKPAMHFKSAGEFKAALLKVRI